MAYLRLGLRRTASALEARAISSDPMDPIFLMGAGFIADRQGNIAKAELYDRAALRSDPRNFAAANDLGVELARQHDYQSAQSALRQAVGANSSYALGWFNLGVLEAKMGLLHLLSSQGAFAKAVSLDSGFKHRRYVMTIDGSTYRSSLDLSKPLPPEWSLAATQRSAPAASVGLLATFLLAMGLARSASQSGNNQAANWLTALANRLDKMRTPRRFKHPAWAVGTTVVAFLLTSLRQGFFATQLGAYTLGLLALVGAAMVVRSLMARRNKVSASESSWSPGMVFGLVSGAIGSPWAALPVVSTQGKATRVHLAAPLTLAAVSAVLFIESAWLSIPITQSFAIAALIMAASTLLPINPLDGANVGKAGMAAAAGVLGGAILIGLGII